MLLRIATRGSDLARWQADHVASLLTSRHPDLEVALVPVSTEGDRRTDLPLSEIGGKGVFCKEVQRAVLAGEADLAVHSAKDLPALTPEGLVLAAVPERGDARDALVGASLEQLRERAASGSSPVVASGSARRRVQLAELVEELSFAELRGNMATRLRRGEAFDAIVVASAALERLGLGQRITEVLDERTMVPQVGQGALAVECRAGEARTRELLEAIEDPRSRTAVDAERAFLSELGGDCSLPAGAHCRHTGNSALELDAVLAPSATFDARPHVARVTVSGDDPESLGRSAARRLVADLGSR